MDSGKNDTIKLLVLVPTLQCGGAEKYVAMLCQHLNATKFSITLAVLNNEIPFYKISNSNVKLIDLKVKQVRYAAFKIRKLIKTLQPDMVYTTANHLNLFLALFKKFIAGNTIIVARETSVVSHNSQRAKSAAIYKRLLKRYYQRLDYFICQSVYMQQDLVNYFAVPLYKTIVIHNPVATTTQIVEPPEKNKLLTVARLSPEKGIDRLIRAVSHLTKPYTYYIIGDGDQKQSLQLLIQQLQLQDNVFLVGPKEEPFAGMEDTAVFLMGSYYEGFPNTLLEANALGIPVVAFDAPGGISEIITDGDNGFLIKNDDEKIFAKAITKAFATNFNRHQIQQTTLSKFATEPIMDQTARFFIEVNAKARSEAAT